MTQSLWKTVWSFLKKLSTELPYDPAITILDIFPENHQSKGPVYPNTHSSTVYNSQDTEITHKCSTADKWTRRCGA